MFHHFDRSCLVEIAGRSLRRSAAFGNPRPPEDALCYLKGEGRYEDRNTYPFPVLLVLDIKMPDRCGFDVLAWMKDHPASRPKAVVVLTGLTDLDDIRRAYDLGTDSFLTKPFLVEDLINAVRGFRQVRVEGNEGSYRLSSAS